jgi:carbon-monoxide dehydrogenase small subunit
VKHLVKLNVNGNQHDVMVSPNETLADAIRRGLGLTGTKISCNQGDCGACTVLMDGKSQLSCISLAMACEGKEIVTIEGLENNGELDPIQRAILEKQGVQCGFCTPGIIMSARGLLDENPHPTREEIKRGLSGNLCRCTGYTKIIEAVESVANATPPKPQLVQVQ